MHYPRTEVLDSKVIGYAPSGEQLRAWREVDQAGVRHFEEYAAVCTGTSGTRYGLVLIRELSAPAKEAVRAS